MSTVTVLEYVLTTLNDTLKVFGEPDDFDRTTPVGSALYELFVARNTIELALSPIGVTWREDNLAECLAACVDTPLFTIRDTAGGSPIEVRLGSFNKEIAERAALLLEEIGK